MTITNSAMVNETTYVVENICVGQPITPSPFSGIFMVGLEDPVYETQTTTNTATHPAGTTVTVNADATVTLTLPGGATEQFPAGTTVIEHADGTVTTTYTTFTQVLITPGTPCGMGWIYDPATGTFSAPQG